MTIDLTRARTTDPDGFRSLYLSKTATEPRPTKALHPDVHERVLANAQAGWDLARATDDRIAAFNTENDVKREAARQAGEAELERKRHEVAARAEAELLRPAKAAYLAGGGDPATWDEVAPAIADKIRESKAVSAAVGTPVERARSLASTF